MCPSIVRLPGWGGIQHIVDDFVVNFFEKEHAEHLIQALQELYTSQSIEEVNSILHSLSSVITRIKI